MAKRATVRQKWSRQVGHGASLNKYNLYWYAKTSYTTKVLGQVVSIGPSTYLFNRSISIFLGMVVGTSWNIRTASKELRISAILFLFIHLFSTRTWARHYVMYSRPQELLLWKNILGIYSSINFRLFKEKSNAPRPSEQPPQSGEKK